MISEKSRYAVKTIMLMAKSDPDIPLTSKQIAERTKIPKRFLENILVILRQQGIVTSLRGSSGGYLLNKDSRKITVRSVLRVIEGPTEPLRCLAGPSGSRCADCESSEDCDVRRAFSTVNDAWQNSLESAVIADFS